LFATLSAFDVDSHIFVRRMVLPSECLRMNPEKQREGIMHL